MLWWRSLGAEVVEPQERQPETAATILISTQAMADKRPGVRLANFHQSR